MELTDADVKALLDSAPDAMVIVDVSGEIVFVNAQTETLFGYGRQELLGHPVESLLPGRFRESHVAHRTAYLSSPRLRPMGAGLELFGLRKDGSEFPVEISLSPLDTESDRLVSSAIRDITDRKEIQNALIEARDEAECANRAKSAFIAAASHDLRQPLQTLSLLNGVLSRTVSDTRALKAIGNQAEALGSMTNLLNSILDISKLESGAIEPDITDNSVQTIFRRLRVAFEEQAKAKGLELIVDDCEDVVRTDSSLLEQIIQNLITNAIRYTKKGLVQLRCLHLDGDIRIEVFDTGIGIPVDELDSIFKEFYQLNREPGQKRQGLGLGLSIVRRMASLLNHPLEVESTLGEGTCIAVTVPQGAQKRVVAPGSSSASAVPKSPATVLIIDDDRAVSDATATLLELEGHHVTIAATGEEARAVITARGIPDMMICDFHLDGAGNGIDVIQHLRRESGRTIPAVLVTGDTSTLVSELLQFVEGCRMLTKPMNPNELVALVQKLIQEK